MRRLADEELLALTVIRASSGIDSSAVREAVDRPALRPDDAGESRIGRAQGSVAAERSCGCHAIRQADCHPVAVVMLRAQPASEQTKIGRYWRELHPRVREECQVCVQVVGVAAVHPCQLIDDFGGVSGRQGGVCRYV